MLLLGEKYICPWNQREMHTNPMQKQVSLLLLGEKYICPWKWREAHTNSLQKQVSMLASWVEIHVSLKPNRTAHHCCCLLERGKCSSLKPKRKCTSHYLQKLLLLGAVAYWKLSLNILCKVANQQLRFLLCFQNLVLNFQGRALNWLNCSQQVFVLDQWEVIPDLLELF